MTRAIDHLDDVKRLTRAEVMTLEVVGPIEPASAQDVGWTGTLGERNGILAGHTCHILAYDRVRFGGGTVCRWYVFDMETGEVVVGIYGTVYP